MKNFKYNIKIKFALLLVSVFLMQSCSDFLEQEPGMQTSITEQLKNKEGVFQAMRGMYGEIEAALRFAPFATYADLQGGNLKFSPSPEGTNKNQIIVPTGIAGIYGFNDLSEQSNLASFYSACYDIINQTNLFLEFADALPDATTAEKNQIKAEALTVRAYAHFLLSQVYTQNYDFTADASHPGLVYSKQSINAKLTYPARETVATTYSFIIDDITTAINLYSDTPLMAGPVYSYFNKTSTKALLARVYLSKKDWKNAYDTANDIIENSGVALMTSENYIAQWEQPDLPVSEVLLEFSIPRSSEGTVSGSMASTYGYTSATIYGSYVASDDLFNLYEADDIRKKLFLEHTIATINNLVSTPVKYNFTKKFQDNPGYVAFRLSEQYLIRAEAALGLNNPEQAKTDINTIRARANATLLNDTDNLQEAVFLERRKELCFEGHLFHDIARNKRNVSRVDGCVSANCSLTYPSPKFILPIPRSNINLNSNLTQNESY
ncbi:RagB/SusD family nutrient uptake outer membrane protein [Flavobacterium hercynium]|uniref:RagB/SusD family nutrient uptake outer membrane protein n=1 Tax=Flavobacterium hercynium TaxID=387094 RepID=A0A226H9B7_9FLAO|nr:RagB/SusD family nutrient uptake outer membrane protein [Flavobacterium hercynium]OXA90438.1 RagB/SusD family nutrient uptake outer membrane protein [Flavobacterium hercynium]SMP26313.1 SusD family protein [Flavobacterium hercynium]